MNSNPHRNNSDFQLRYFLAGSCYTVDGAWMLMYGQMIDREAVVKICEAGNLRREAKRLEEQKVLDNPSSSASDKLRAQANLMEMEANSYTADKNYEAAKMELATIKTIMAELEPHRKYAHLPILEANEAAQREEWLGEFKNRIENYLYSVGTIPEDHLRAMRNHPDFQSELVPYMKTVLEKLTLSKNSVECLANHSNYFLEDQ